MTAIRHAVILAAGRGQRMRPLTDVLPKPMAPYLGSTLIAQGITRIASSIENIYVTVGYKGAMLAQHVIEHGATGVFNTEGRGNAWWIYNTLLRHLDEPICVLTCDNVVELDMALLQMDYNHLDTPACMLVPVLPVPGLEGDYIFRRGSIVTELSRVKVADIYCSGIQILNPCQICRLTQKEDGFYQVWNQLIQQERLFVSSVYPMEWFAVDTMEHLMYVNQGQHRERVALPA